MNESFLRILVAEDEPTARLLMRAALEKFGFKVMLASDGEHALELFNKEPFDMLMVDVEMPRMNGHQLCAAVRAKVGDELPIVMVTGMDDVDSITQAYRSGATDFIAKPINWNLIGHRVLYLRRAQLNLIALRSAYAHNAAIIRAIPDTMFRLRNDGMVLETGGNPDGSCPLLPGQPLTESFPATIVTEYLGAITRARGSGLVETIEYQLGQADKTVRHKECRLTVIDAQETLCLERDITERKEAEQRIMRLAHFDSLTGLPNRQGFFERLGREVQRARYNDSKLALLFMDLDGFKNINDTLGHGAGDQLLQSVADRLCQSMRPSDTISRLQPFLTESELARLGGDEFTVIIPNMTNSEDVMTVARRICDAMHHPFSLRGREVVLTASIGIAIYPEDCESASSLLEFADTAMYHAKELGRDNYQFYRAALTQKAMKRLNMESDLRRALERQEFFLLYQPQLDVESGRILSVEALIRWKHPEQGLISPMDFIPMAEGNGLIVPIGEWVLRTACTDATRWLAAGNAIRVAVNLSPAQFKSAGLLKAIFSSLAESGLPPELLELEVTEGALMEDSDATLETLNTLRSRGIHLSLDDFGTGYSSMSYLKRLPLNNLKVDQSFVRGLPDDKESLSIVTAIISMAINLGFTVTAEGVETVEQAQLLKTLSCNLLQGYYFSMPIAEGDIPAILLNTWLLEP